MGSMQQIANFRELGGLPAGDGGRVRSGVMFRSGHLADTTEADRQALSDLGIRTVIDLRADHELVAEGEDNIPDGIEHVRVPIHDDAGHGEEIRRLVSSPDMDEVRAAFGEGRALQMARSGSADMARRGRRMASFRPALEVITDPTSWPVLWHCSAGKDRAGWTATAVLLAVGADRGAIVEHYLASNGQGLSARGDWGSPEMMELLGPFVSVHADYIEAQLEVVDTDWGGVEVLFAEGYGLDSTSLARLRAELLEP